MVKRKREDSNNTWASQGHPIVASVVGTLPKIPTTNVLSAAEVELREVMDDFVTVYERLDQVDDPKAKPNYSYTEMIYLAILRSPNFCLPISEIYRYIKSRFSFFRTSARKHWCNAVRHSLSKTKCFTKIAVGRGSSGNNKLNRSTYLWCIVPGSIVNFARGDYRPNVDTESGTNTLRWGYFRVNAGQFWDQVAVYLEKKMEVFQQLVYTTPSPGKLLEAQACFVTGSLQTDISKSSAIEDIPQETVFSAKPVCQPTHTIHHGPSPLTSRLSDSGFSNSVLQSPNILPNNSTDNDILPNNSRDNDILQNNSRDSGNESLLDINQQEKRRKYSNDIPKPSAVYPSFNSTSSSVLDDTRKTPDLPDLGHVSPLSIPPSLSPIGNTTYDSEAMISYSSFYPPPPSYASTPVIASLPHSRISQVPAPYSRSISPPLFSSLSPATCQSSRESSFQPTIFPEYYQPYAPPVYPPLPYLQSAVNNPLVPQPGLHMSHCTTAPSSHWPYQTGSYGFGSLAPSYVSQMGYQHNPYNYQQQQHIETPLTLNLQQKLDSVLSLEGLDWGTV